MNRPGAGLLALTLAACASAPPPSWRECHCDSIEERARNLAGSGMIDCGFVNLIEDRSRETLRAGMRCARHAFESSTAFRYGSIRIPVDSYATEVLVRAADGSLWLLTYDIMVDGDTPQSWVQRCERLRFKAHNSGFVVDGCKNVEESTQ
jgi:hypothetical protein